MIFTFAQCCTYLQIFCPLVEQVNILRPTRLVLSVSTIDPLFCPSRLLFAKWESRVRSVCKRRASWRVWRMQSEAGLFAFTLTRCKHRNHRHLQIASETMRIKCRSLADRTAGEASQFEALMSVWKNLMACLFETVHYVSAARGWCSASFQIKITISVSLFDLAFAYQSTEPESRF